MAEAFSRAFFLAFANSPLLTKAGSKHGMRGPISQLCPAFSERQDDEVLLTIGALNRQVFRHILSHLGSTLPTREH